MKSTRFASFCGRNTVALIFVSSLFLFSCSQNIENDSGISAPQVSTLQVLSNSDPIAGTFSTSAYSVYGSDTAFIFQENIAYATSCSCSNLESTEGKTEGKDFQKIPSYGTDLIFDLSSSEKIYVNYNIFSDADLKDGIQENEIDKHSGVILFRAKYSPYENPVQNCYYGVKFQFTTVDGNIPEKIVSSTKYSNNKAFIEGGYNDLPEYKNAKTLEQAKEMFAFDNYGYFSESSWTEALSGADKK